MFIKKKTEPSGLEKIIDYLQLQMLNVHPETKEYAIMAAQLSNLYKLKEINSPKPISRDTMAIIIGNLVGIGMILSYEKVNVVTSKALGFVMKSR